MICKALLAATFFNPPISTVGGGEPREQTEKRPWGYFERFTLNEPCTVKLLYVDANKRLSLQYHNNRSEFWKVVKGPVKVQLGEEINVQHG